MNKNKRGELTTQQIVLLIILIMSFVVILYFLFHLGFFSKSEIEICHHSVVLRGNSILSKSDVPLNCQRIYVCLTNDGTCEQMTNPTIVKVESKTEVYYALAEEMANCWWMFGEGQVDYIGGKALKVNYCSICTQLAFDDSILDDGNLKEDFEDGMLDKNDFYNYLASTPMEEEGETYAEYLLGTNDIGRIKSEVPDADSFGTMDLTKQQFVVMGIVSELGGFQKALGTGIITSVATIYTGLVGGAIVFFAGQDVAEGIVGEFRPEIGALTREGDGIENEFMVPTLIEANSEEFKSLECKDVVTLT